MDLRDNKLVKRLEKLGNDWTKELKMSRDSVNESFRLLEEVYKLRNILVITYKKIGWTPNKSWTSKKKRLELSTWVQDPEKLRRYKKQIQGELLYVLEAMEEEGIKSYMVKINDGFFKKQKEKLIVTDCINEMKDAIANEI